MNDPLQHLPDLDQDYLRSQLSALINIPSPSGFTDAVVRHVSGELTKMGIEHGLTRRGAIRARLPGVETDPKRAVVVHLDTLGAMVKGLKPNGRLKVAKIGYWSARFAEGARVTIFTDKGTRRGTILPLKASGHTFNDEIDSQPVSWDNLEIRVDEPCDSVRQLELMGFNVGDYIAIDPNLEISANGFINSRHLDDKAGAAALLTMLKALKENNITPSVNCHVLFTISEEVGSGASAVLHGDIAEMVAIDNGTPAPGQNSSEFGVTVAMMDSSGPFDYHLTRKLLSLCGEHSISHQRDVFKYYRCDAAAAIEAGNDIRTALICFGVDASHGYERTHIDSLRSLAALLLAYVQSPPTSWRDREDMGPVDGMPEQPGDSDEAPPVFTH